MPPNIRQELYRENVQNPSPIQTNLTGISSAFWGIGVMTSPGNLTPGQPLLPVFSYVQKQGDAVIGIEHGDMIVTTQTPGNAIRFTTTPAPLPTIPVTQPSDFERMTITTDGNVGIGTKSPNERLHLADGVFRISRSSQSMQMTIAPFDQAYSDFSAEGDFVIRSTQSAKGVVITARTATGGIHLGTGLPDLERLTITNAGDVGIGLTSPLTRLQVHGNAMVGVNDGTHPSMLTVIPSQSGSWWNMASVDNGARVVFGQGNQLAASDNSNTDWTGSILTLEPYTVGVGTIRPADRLHVDGGALRVSNGSATAQMAIAPDPGSYSDFATANDFVVRSSSGSEDLILTARTSTGAVRIGAGVPDAEAVTVLANGNVGIGVTAPAAKLTVNGLVCATECRVALPGSSTTCWPDFVFADDYKLMPLAELEENIRRQKHLPGIPSNAQVEAEGIELGDMQGRLLLKVEELTLYVIDLKKQNDALARRIEELEK